MSGPPPIPGGVPPIPGILPEFTPTERPPPQRALYPVEKLHLFGRFNRSSYRELVGENAPFHRSQDEAPELIREGIPEDQAESHTRIKRWQDQTVEGNLDGPYTYLTLAVVDGAPKWLEITITRRLARWINLPGQYNYPKWVVAPTPAVVVGTGGDSATLNPSYLATVDQAQMLKQELDADSLTEHTLGGGYQYVWGTEKRRVFMVHLSGGEQMTAAYLIRRRFEHGVDAPGHWINPESSPQWVLEVDPDVGEHDLRPEFPLPMRPLYPTERAEVGGFAGTLRIINQEFMPEPDSGVLARIDRNVQTLLERD